MGRGSNPLDPPARCAPVNKNADLDKYKSSGYNTGFDSCSEFLFTDGSMGKYFCG